MNSNNKEIDNKQYNIYKITNLVNNKCYIGRTCNFDRRINEHQREDSHCIKLKNAIYKYGWDNFTTEILEYCLGDKQTAEREKYNIWLYESFGSKGYNLTSGGENYIVSEETRLKISIATSGENNPMFGKTGELSPSFGLKRTEESTLKRSGENHWAYGLAKEDNPRFGEKQSEETKEKRAEKHRKQFLVTFPDGHTEITKNLIQFCKDNNLNYSGMKNVANGVKYQKSHKGFKCEHYRN